MIDIEKIKSLPDDKPYKGPHRMGKSDKDEWIRNRYKIWSSFIRQSTQDEIVTIKEDEGQSNE